MRRNKPRHTKQERERWGKMIMRDGENIHEEIETEKEIEEGRERNDRQRNLLPRKVLKNKKDRRS